jgi:acetyl esterase
MTRSLLGAPDLDLGAKRAPKRWTSRVQGAVTTLGAKVIPWIPTAAKRVLFHGRSVIIDGNTLDPTLQLMLSGLRVVGIDGLVVDDDPAASRAQIRESTVGLPGPQIHVEVDDLSLPGPVGEIRARHYRPAGGAAAPLLVFYHGGGWAIGDLDTYDALCRLTCRDAGIHVLSIDWLPSIRRRPPSRMLMRPSSGPTSTPVNSARSPVGSRSAATVPAATWPPSCPNWRATRGAPRPCCSG